MTNILDQIQHDRAQYSDFEPAAPHEYLGLRLATRLGDAAAGRHYAALAEEYSEGHLVFAYSRAIAIQNLFQRLKRFHQELEAHRCQEMNQPPKSRLIAVRIDRRAVAVAILHGDRLHYVDG